MPCQTEVGAPTSQVIMKPFLFLSLILSLVSGCAAQPGPLTLAPASQATGISVHGEGQVTAKPDIAYLNLGVEVRAASASKATDELGRRMSQVVASLKARGVNEEDIQTSQLSVHMEHSSPVRPLPGDGAELDAKERVQQMHRATNTVEVVIRDLDQAASIISEALDSGANAVHGIRFDVEQDEPFVDQARELAFAQARHRAQELAKLAGIQLGAARLISEQGSFNHPRMATAEMRAGVFEMPVERGSLDITHRVEVTFEIEDATPSR